jgi:hypothetical protein
MSIFFENVCSVVAQDLKFVLIQYIVDKLRVQFIVDKSDGKKKLPPKPNPNQLYMMIFLLKCLSAVLESLGNLINDKIQQPNQITELLNEYLNHENLDIQVTAAYGLYYLINSYPRSRAQTISVLQDSITLSRAEIATATLE